jgi:surface protein
MAIQSASAKLYTGIRCWVVDKNISAALTASFSLGNRNRPASGGDTVFANVLVFKLQRAIADLVMTPSVSLTNERYRTYGGGNTVQVPGYTTTIAQAVTATYNTFQVESPRTFNEIVGRASSTNANISNSQYRAPSWAVVFSSTANPISSTISFTLKNPGQFISVGDTFTIDATIDPLIPVTATITVTSIASVPYQVSGGWITTASIVCKFPTYFRIDVDKLQLPQGTTCTVSFEEDWIRDGVYLESTKASSAAIGNFFTFRTPWKGASFMNSTFIGLGSFLFRRRNPGIMAFTSAFTPVMSARLTRRGVIDLQSAFIANIIAGEIVRPLSRMDLFAVAGRIGPAGVPYLEGNGFPYYNINGTLTGLGIFPGITRIRQSTATFDNVSTASLSAEVFNLPFIVPPVNLSDTFTMTAQLDAFKGVGTPSLQAQSSMTSAATVNYNSTIPTMQSNFTVFAKTPLQASAALTASSSISADVGQSLELVWFANAGETIGVLFKGPTINISLKWNDGVQNTIVGGAINSDVGNLPTSYYTRSCPITGYYTLRVTGALSGFQFSRNGVDLINGGINADDSFLGPAPTWAVAGRNRLVACNGWGDLGITDLSGAFANCSTLDTVPNFLPKGIQQTACMFLNCININDPAVLTWNTSTITNMAGMFRQASQFNQPIGVWNTSNVTNMRRMFRGGNSNNYPSTTRDSSFNQSLNGWDVTKVSRANMEEMFYFNELMAGNCNQWCVSHISTAPTLFASSTTTLWPIANRPIWGTCP